MSTDRRRRVPPRDWRRRAAVWPAIALGAPIVVALAPLLFAVALVLDLFTGPTRLRFVRLVGMTLNYLVLTMAGLIAGFVLWLATGFGAATRTRWSQRAHHRVQMWWTGSMLRAVERWLGAAVTIRGSDLARSGPIVVLARHASFFDAVVPSVVVDRGGDLRVRHVLKQELSWEPCLGLFGHRLQNHFVDRWRGGGRDVGAIEALAAGAGDDALIIFPEGTFRSASASARVLERFAQREPERAARLQLRHLLPPRPGGVSALLDGAPEADVVVIGHVGFEAFGSFRSIVANTPFRHPVQVEAWRIPRCELPEESAARLAFIDEQWQRLDDWIEDHHSRRAQPS